MGVYKTVGASERGGGRKGDWAGRKASGKEARAGGLEGERAGGRKGDRASGKEGEREGSASRRASGKEGRGGRSVCQEPRSASRALAIAASPCAFGWKGAAGARGTSPSIHFVPGAW